MSNETIGHAQPGDTVIVVPETVTIHSVTLVSEPHPAYFFILDPAVGLVNRAYQCSLPIPLMADSVRFSYCAADYLRILVECPDRGIVMDGDIRSTGAEWRTRLWSLVPSRVGVPLKLTFASSLPFMVDHLCFTEELQRQVWMGAMAQPLRAGPPVDSDRSSLEDWAQAVDRLCAEVGKEAP